MMAVSHTDPVHALTRFAFLAGAPPDALNRFVARARWIDAKPNETVVEFGDATTDVFFVVQGSVRVFMRTADGEHTQILGDFVVGDLVGEMSAIDDAPRSARVEALVRTRLCVVSAAAFLDFAFAARSVGLYLMRLLTARIRGQNERLLEHTVLPTRLRVAAELFRLSRPRPDGICIVSPPPTHEELAARVGARRETVSRDLSALTRAGLLRRTRSAFVLDNPAALRAAVEGHGDDPRQSLTQKPQDLPLRPDLTISDARCGGANSMPRLRELNGTALTPG